MPIKLNNFQEGSVPANSDFLVGYTSTTAGGERRWTFNALRTWLANQLPTMRDLLSPVGAVVAFPCTTAPAGWLSCNGQTVLRSQYPALWSFAQNSGCLVSDSAYWAGASGGFSSAGPENTHFRLPDLRGEFVRGWADPSAAGGGGNATWLPDRGRTIGTKQGDMFRSHNHHIGKNDNMHSAGRRNITGIEINRANGKEFNLYTDSNGGDETRPRNIALMYCIKF